MRAPRASVASLPPAAQASARHIRDAPLSSSSGRPPPLKAPAKRLAPPFTPGPGPAARPTAPRRGVGARTGSARQLRHSTMAQEGASTDEYAPLPPAIHAIVHQAPEELDPEAPGFLKVLRDSAAVEIWHKHGNFFAHLHDVWQTLCVWQQPTPICRLGLFHSAYSNSFVSMNLFNPDTDRPKLAGMIGEEGEDLVYKFCVIDRQAMEDFVATEMYVPAGGLILKHIRTGGDVHCSREEIGAFLLETVADYHDQSFGWQSDLEAGHVKALWPGIYKPTLRMNKVAKFAFVAARDCNLQVVPPVFNNCTRLIEPSDEAVARDAYWSVVTEAAPKDQWLELLRECSRLNPDIAEPHAVAALVLLQEAQWEEAAESAMAALDVFYQWGTMWDNRMPFEAWVAWCRCMYFQAKLKEWPGTHGGIESLGAVHPSQRFRALSTGRAFGKAPARPADNPP